MATVVLGPVASVIALLFSVFFSAGFFAHEQHMAKSEALAADLACFLVFMLNETDSAPNLLLVLLYEADSAASLPHILPYEPSKLI